MIMDSRDLTYVLTVRDTQNFSKAAQRLFISQPSLSQYIRRLEQRLGEPIFFRDKAQVMLTPFGEVYAREAEKLLNCIHQMEETLHLAKERNRSMIRVGISQSYSKSFVPAIIKIVHKLRPDSDVAFVDGISTLLEKEILEGRISFGIFPGPPARSDVAFVPLCQDPLYFAVSRDNKKAVEILKSAWSGKFLDLAAFRDFPFVLHTKGAKLRDLTFHICQSFGFLPRPICESETLDTLYSLVNHNYGVAILSLTPLTNLSEKENRVLFFPLLTPSATRTFGFYCSRDQENDSFIQKVAKAMRIKIEANHQQMKAFIERDREHVLGRG